jgi:hypothetical protein
MMKRWLASLAIGCLAPALALAQQAQEIPELPETTVEAAPNQPGREEPPPVFDPFNEIIRSGPSRADMGPGSSNSASSGVFGQPDLQFRPILRPAAALEVVPGLIITQQSGSGKANQYFLRGVNLDHGTDFFVRVDGVPINLPTHAHGQGYLDLNWLIPELVERVDYRLGTYYADVGDFSSVGAADVQYARTLPTGIARITAGSFDYYRLLAADSTEFGGGDLLYAFEGNFNNGPWDVPENFRKLNGVVKYTIGDECEGATVTGLAYRADWTATNQIAQRALDAGIVGRFGSLDPSDGGRTDRLTLNGQYWRETELSLTKANAYVAEYDLNLYSNFTFFLDDPINGDQINQVDRRVYSGLNLSHERFNDYGSNTIGFQFRNDNISNVALNHTTQRQFLSATAQDDVDQQNYAVYGVNKLQWTDYVRTDLGLRGDFYRFHSVSAVNPIDSGTTDAAILSPKTSLVLGPWDSTEVYLNWGLSFHSNDARGINNSLAPATPLVRSNGSEIGARSKLTDEWTSSLALWYLELDSELVFVGDAGTTEPAGASHRSGVNWTNFVKLNDYTTLDFDYAHVRPRLEGGERIANAVENVLAAGFTARMPDGGWYGTLRVQSYGPAALIEDNSARSHVTTICNAQVGYLWERAQLAVDIFNLLDTKANDITYFYESAPAGLGPAADYHFHPVQPASARATLTYSY